MELIWNMITVCEILQTILSGQSVNLVKVNLVKISIIFLYELLNYSP